MRNVLWLGAFALLAGRPIQDPSISRPFNLDFEMKGYRDHSWPWGWRNYSPGARSPAGSVALDSTQKHGGVYGLRLRRDSVRNRPIVAVGHFLRAEQNRLRGKRVRFSIWAQTDSLTGGGILIRAGTGTNENPIRDTVFVSKSAAGETHGWRRYSVDVPVSESDTDLDVRVTFRGFGTVWLDDAEIAVDGVPIKGEAPLQSSSADEAQWLRRNAITLEALDAIGESSALQAMIGSARVVGVGEATHGSSEFQQIKHQVTRLLAKNPGPVLFALEESQLKAERINRWVRTGEGNPRLLMTDFYNIWQTDEMVALIEWMRRAKQGGTDIEFVGVDVIDARPPIDSVLAFLRRVDTSYAQQAADAYRAIRDVWEKEQFAQQDSTIRNFRREATRVFDHMREARGTYEQRSDTNVVSWAVQNANAVVQSIMLLGGTDRDTLMAANLLWYLKRRGPASRAVFAAHNGHVRRMDDAVGAFMSSAGIEYRAIGTSAYAGSYSADTSAGRPLAIRSYQPTPLYPAPAGSVDAALHALQAPFAVVDLRSAARAGVFDGDRVIRFSGVVAVDWAFQGQPVTRNYDVLIFADRTKAARMLPCPAGLLCGG